MNEGAMRETIDLLGIGASILGSVFVFRWLNQDLFPRWWRVWEWKEESDDD